MIFLSGEARLLSKKAHFYPLIGLFTLLIQVPGFGQISPPGLDGAKAAGWAAVGINQRFSNKWSTTVYVGGSLQSDPDNFAAFKKSAIFVLNQETLYQFNSNWQTAFCTSLRYNSVYEEDSPYGRDDPGWRKEIRYYLRFFYKSQKSAIAWTHSFRPEYRTFYDLDGQPWTSPHQIRLRAKIQANIPVNGMKTNYFIVANEWLGASAENSTGEWSSFQFTEDRLSTFFRHVFTKPSVFMDIGLMHQFWESKERKLNYTTYLSFDLLFQSPFGKK